ncbi:MAG: cupin domain-containing protein [Thermoproteota archaeon]|nr:cupin domain-containing protein [Thermoproteota archaeon]
MPTERTAFGLKAGEGKGSHQISFRGTKIAVKVSKEDSEDRFTLLEIIHPPHVGPALHIHPDAPEAYYVLEGEYQIVVGKESRVGNKRQVYDVKTGDFVFIPKGLEHKYRSGPAGGKVLVISPAGLEKYFIEVADI